LAIAFSLCDLTCLGYCSAMGDASRILAFAPTEAPPAAPTCIDLFSGAGGLAEGFRQAGWAVVAAADSDRHASETFRLNFPEARFYEGSVSQLSAAQILADCRIRPGRLDCLIGGPPCQSFSYNNHQRSASDARARLFRAYLELVAGLRPKTVVMENVPGMLTIGDGAVVRALLEELNHLGFDCTVRIVFAEDFGVPQLRRRVFLVGSRRGKSSRLWPQGTHGPSSKPSSKVNVHVHRWTPSGPCLPLVTVWDAIGDLPRIQNGATAGEVPYRSSPRTEFQATARVGSAPKVRNHVCHALTAKILQRIVHVPEGGNWRSIPRRLLPAGMKRARLSDHTKRYGRLKRSAQASTILTKCDPHWGAYVHPTQQRTISVREAARLQGFPDSFFFPGSHASKHYSQVGNAVPPPVACAIAETLLRHVAR
jgi:DNA (cytosine-5)-methyltransferase 1